MRSILLGTDPPQVGNPILPQRQPSPPADLEAMRMDQRLLDYSPLIAELALLTSTARQSVVSHLHGEDDA